MVMSNPEYYKKLYRCLCGAWACMQTYSQTHPNDVFAQWHENLISKQYVVLSFGHHDGGKI